jgi:hypothetical protein
MVPVRRCVGVGVGVTLMSEANNKLCHSSSESLTTFDIIQEAVNWFAEGSVTGSTSSFIAWDTWAGWQGTSSDPGSMLAHGKFRAEQSAVSRKEKVRCHKLPVLRRWYGCQLRFNVASLKYEPISHPEWFGIRHKHASCSRECCRTRRKSVAYQLACTCFINPQGCAVVKHTRWDVSLLQT